MDNRFTIKFKDNLDCFSNIDAPFNTTSMWRYPSNFIIKELENNGITLEDILQSIQNNTPIYREEIIDDYGCWYVAITIIEPHKNNTWRVAVGVSPTGRGVSYWEFDYLVKKVV